MFNLFRGLTFFAAFLLGLSAAQARPPVSIVNHDHLPIQTASGKALTPPDVRSILLAAGAQMNPPWQFNDASDNRLIGSYSVRNGKHVIVIDITYAADHYAIRYKDSINMNYQTDYNNPSDPMSAKTGPVIHPNYNAWVNKLINTVRVEALRR